jgi:hypothetical protein
LCMQSAGLGAAMLLTVCVPVVCMMLHSALEWILLLVPPILELVVYAVSRTWCCNAADSVCASLMHDAAQCFGVFQQNAVGMMSHYRCACSRCNKLPLHCDDTVLMGAQASCVQLCSTHDEPTRVDKPAVVST